MASLSGEFKSAASGDPAEPGEAAAAEADGLAVSDPPGRAARNSIAGAAAAGAERWRGRNP
jgi:hypothetical protein